MIRQMLRSRDIEVAEGFPADAEVFAAASEEALLAAAFACTTEADFLDALRR